MRRGNQKGVLALYGQRTLGRGAAAKQPTHARGGEGTAQKVAQNLGWWEGIREVRGAPAEWGSGTPSLQAWLSRG